MIIDQVLSKSITIINKMQMIFSYFCLWWNFKDDSIHKSYFERENTFLIKLMRELNYEGLHNKHERQ